MAANPNEEQKHIDGTQHTREEPPTESQRTEKKAECSQRETSEERYQILRTNNENIYCYPATRAQNNFRADFRDPRGKWQWSDVYNLPYDLTSNDNWELFRKTMQQCAAYIMIEQRFIQRGIGSNGRPKFHVARTLDTNIGDKLIKRENGMPANVSFRTAVGRIIRDIMYNEVVFEPYYGTANGLHIPDSKLNLWTGFFREEVSEPLMANVQPFLNHLRNVWCNSNAELYEYALNWFAYLIQKPGNPQKTALIIRGARGCGKSSIIEYFGEWIIGREYFYTAYIDALKDKYDYEIDKSILILIHGMGQIISPEFLETRFRKLITAETFRYRTKGVPAYIARNAIHLIFISDIQAPLPLPPDNRKFCVFLCAPITASEHQSYFANLFQALKTEESANAIFTYFARRDISSFDITNIPTIPAKPEAPIGNLSAPLQFINDFLSCMIVPWVDENKEYTIESNEFFVAFCDWAKQKGIQNIPTRRAFDMKIVQIFGKTKQIREDGPRVRKRQIVIALARKTFTAYLNALN